MKTRARRRAPIAAVAAFAFTFLALSLICHAGAIGSMAPDLLHLPCVPTASADSEVVPVHRQSPAPEYVDGQIIVKIKQAPIVAGASAESAVDKLGAFCARMGAEILDSTCIGPDAEVFLVGVPVSMTVDEAAMAYGAKEFIEYAEPNYLWYPDAPAIPNDPFFWRLWGMENTGQDFYPGVFWEKGIAGCDISAPEAWGVRTDASSVLVAVIDTGIDVSHYDLTNNIWRNPGEVPDNGIDDDGNGFIDDVYGWDFANDDNSVFDDPSADRHATHCAGTIGGEGDNAYAVAGVAWKAQIMSCKFIHGRSGSTWDAIDAINYASMMGAKIASNSWGGGGESTPLKEAIANSGMLFIASAGNSAENTDVSPHYPSSYDLPNIVSVAASDWNDDLAGFSCYGLETVDLAAPGYWILSSIPGNKLAWMAGTSMATPHVSGAAALVSAQFPHIPLYHGAEGWVDGELTIHDILLMSVDRTPGLAGKMTSGGRLNVANAVKMAFPVVIETACADIAFGPAPLAVGFSATVEDPAAVAECWWSFGDGSEYVYSYNASHTYSEEGAYLACFHVLSAGVESTWPMQIVAADPGTIVYVDDDGGFAFDELFQWSCETAGLNCVVVDARRPLCLPDSFNDRLLAWNTSRSWNDTLLPEQEEFLARFLDNGGRLLMISPDYLRDLGYLTPFAQRCLRVWDYVGNVPMGQWDGIDGDLITDGMSITGQLGLGLEDAVWPDLNAKPILKNEDYEVEIWPALRYASERDRVVFTTVPWEEIPRFEPVEEGDPINPDPNNSTYFLAKIYDYLMGEINIPPAIDAAEADLYFAQVNETITFTAQAHDADGDALTYVWEFDSIDDPVVGKTARIAFDEPGVYGGLLTVEDARGESTKALIAVTVSNPGGVVFVDDDDSDGDTEEHFFAAFDAIRQDYVAVSPELVMGGADGTNGAKAGLERFRIVWNCGELGGLDEAEQLAVADYLDKGGALFLVGQEVMFGLPSGSAFARDVLHVKGVEHDVGTAWVEGVDNDPITDGMMIYLGFPPGFDDWTDSLEVSEDAKAILLNDGGLPCALRYGCSGHRLVFMAVAFEAFPLEPAEEPSGSGAVGPLNGDPATDAGSLLAKVLAWLERPMVTVIRPLAGQTCTGATVVWWEATDPIGEELSIDVQYSTDGGSAWIALASGEANDGTYAWDLTKLSRSGPYMIRVIAAKPDGFSACDVGDEFIVSVVGSNQFAAGPNPASDVINFYINASGEANLYIYDIAGRLVFSQKTEGGQTYFDWYLVNNAGKPLANGLYLCYMVTADGVKTNIMRLVISRQQGVSE